MPALVFNTCCGCIELRTGCLIIGYINLVAEIVVIIMGLIALIGGAAIATDGKEDHAQAGSVVMALAIVLLLVTLFFLAFTIVLLVGLHQNKRGHIKAYLICAVIFLVISIIMFFAGFAGHVTAAVIAKDIIVILLNAYFLLVIRSYYYKMDENRPAIYNTA